MDLCQYPGTNMAGFTQLCHLFTDGTAVYCKSKPKSHQLHPPRQQGPDAERVSVGTLVTNTE